MSAVNPYLQSHLGEHAAQAGRTGLDGLRALAAQQPDLSYQLAEALEAAALEYRLDGRFAEAVRASREAVELARDLVQKDPARISLLSSALESSAAALASAGRTHEANEVLVELRRVQSYLSAREGSGAIRGSIRAFDHRAHATPPDADASVIDAHERVAVYEQLVAGSAAYRPELVREMLDLVAALSAAGAHDEAVAAASRAIQSARQVVEVDPGRAALLTASLVAGSRAHRAGGDDVQALELVEEAGGRAERLHAAGLMSHSTLADILIELSVQQGERGLEDGALQSIGAAAGWLRLETGANESSRLRLAHVLNDLAVQLGEAGQRADAVAPAQEAAAIYRQLIGSQPVLRPDLARSLMNLGNHYSAIGRVDDAASAIEEAVALYRQAGDHHAELATALNNLAVQYSEMGRAADALVLTEAAVREWRSLADQDPAEHANLAMSLNNLGNRYVEGGRAGEASVPIEEAVRHYRRLVAERPDTHLPHLAMAVGNLSRAYAQSGRLADALGLASEAAEHYRAIAAANPAYVPELAAALDAFGVLRATSGDADGALPLFEESAALRTELARQNPRFRPERATSLSHLAECHAQIGSPVAAAESSADAVGTLRQLAAENPSWVPQLGQALTRLAQRFDEVGRESDALSCAAEAVEIYRGEAGRQSSLTRALRLLGWLLAKAGRYAEAQIHCEEALELCVATDDEPGELAARLLLAQLALRREDRQQAERMIERSRLLAERLEDDEGIAVARYLEAARLLASGDPLRAVPCALDVLAVSRRTPDLRPVALDLLIGVLSAAGKDALAAELGKLLDAEEAAKLLEQLGDDASAPS